MNPTTLDDLIAEHLAEQAAEAARKSAEEFTDLIRRVVREEIAATADAAYYASDGCASDALYRLVSAAQS